MSGFSDLDPEAIGTALAGTRFNRIETVTQTGSTNQDVLERGRSGEAEGLVRVADTQTSGRGRRGRSWLAPSGGALLCSVLVRTAGNPELITATAGLAAIEAVESTTGLAPDLKWPNDLMLDDLKIAGILTETVGERGEIRLLVVGLGLNVNSHPDDVDVAGSISGSLGRRVERGRILESYLRNLDRTVTMLENETEALLTLYRRRCSTIGRDVAIDAPGGLVEGRAEGIDGHGRLLVSTDGVTVAVGSGDVA